MSYLNPSRWRDAASVAVALGVVALALASPAVANHRDAVTDPNSPSGTEYDLPADRARDETDGSAGGRRSGGGEAPSVGAGSPNESPGAGSGSTGSRAGGSPALFGVGIRPSAPAAAGGGGGGAGGDRPSDARGGSRGRDRSGRDEGPRSNRGLGSDLFGRGNAAAREAAAAGTSGAAHSTLFWLGGLAAIVLAGGAVIALALRRSSRGRGIV